MRSHTYTQKNIIFAFFNNTLFLIMLLIFLVIKLKSLEVEVMECSLKLELVSVNTRSAVLVNKLSYTVAMSMSEMWRVDQYSHM